MKRYMTDTHALLWYGAGQLGRLGPRARRAFRGLETSATEIIASVISLWEIATLHDEGAIRLPAGFTAWCDALEACPGLRVEPLLRADVEEARALGTLRDPHDRLIAGTALRLGVALITHDATMAESSLLKTIW